MFDKEVDYETHPTQQDESDDSGDDNLCVYQSQSTESPFQQSKSRTSMW